MAISSMSVWALRLNLFSSVFLGAKVKQTLKKPPLLKMYTTCVITYTANKLTRIIQEFISFQKRETSWFICGLQLRLVTTQTVLKVTFTWMMFLVTHQFRTTGSHSLSLHRVSGRRIFLSCRGPSWQVPNNRIFHKLEHVRLLADLFQLIFHPFSYPSALWI